MVSRAENTGEVLEKAAAGSLDSYVLRRPGTAPVITFGRSSRQPSKLWYLPGISDGDADPAPYMQLGMVDGTWELEILDGKPRLVCDTPDITGSFSAPFTIGNRD
jgi:hypothetical protein